MQIAIFGLSANPVHNGHVFIVNDVLQNGIDKVIVIPCYRHVFKDNLVDYDFRFNMCVESFKRFGEKVEVSDIEKRINKERNYTIDTLKAIEPELKERYIDINLRLLVGSDILNEKDKWEEWNEIEIIAPPIVATRKDYYPSSTELRKKLETGYIDIDLIPEEVVELLKIKNPYYKAD